MARAEAEAKTLLEGRNDSAEQQVVACASEEEQEVVATPPPKQPRRSLSWSSGQSSLKKFFGTPEERENALPVPLPLVALGRVRDTEAMNNLRTLQKQFESTLVAAAPPRKRLCKGGRPPGSQVVRSSSNRKKAGTAFLRREFSAFHKAAMCSDIENMRSTHGENDLWRKAAAKYGVSVGTLKTIKSKEAEWKTLVAKHKLGSDAARGKRKASRACRFVRQPGGGRKRALNWAVTALKEWHARERRHGHSISRKDMVDEYVTLLQDRASQLSGQVASLADSDPLRQVLEKEAQTCLERRDKLVASRAYRKTMMTRLVEWTGARLLTVEQTTHLSSLEEKVRAQLTWQDVDRKLWAMCVASKEQLEKEDLVADAASAIAHRSDFVVGMSDQIPLWAKADCKRLVFHESEIRNLLGDSRKNFHGLREELEACQAEVSALQGLCGPGRQLCAASRLSDEASAL